MQAIRLHFITTVDMEHPQMVVFSNFIFMVIFQSSIKWSGPLTSSTLLFHDQVGEVYTYQDAHIMLCNITSTI